MFSIWHNDVATFRIRVQTYSFFFNSHNVFVIAQLIHDVTDICLSFMSIFVNYNGSFFELFCSKIVYVLKL